MRDKNRKSGVAGRNYVSVGTFCRTKNSFIFVTDKIFKLIHVSPGRRFPDSQFREFHSVVCRISVDPELRLVVSFGEGRPVLQGLLRHLDCFEV